MRRLTVAAIHSARRTPPPTLLCPSAEIEPVGAAEQILRRYGARAISLLTSARQTEDGRRIPARLSANDCYVALEEACRKMARVAVRKFRQDYAPDGLDFAECLEVMFPDPAAYLARAIKSVIADEERIVRREVPVVSLDKPLGADDGEGTLRLADTVAEERPWKQPERSLVEREERQEFRAALSSALRAIPANYLEALKRDIARERERQAGAKVAPESDRERQTVCRARAALSQILRRECGEDNPFVHLLARQRSSRVRHKATSAAEWTGERQENLFRRLMQTGWTERASARADGSLEEAVVNDVSAAGSVAPPSPEMRQAMRVLDLYTVDYPTPRTPAAQELYARARALRQDGKIEEALKFFRACHDAEPTFIEALNNAGNLYSQLGNLRDALRVFLSIIERDPPGDHKYIAACNAADIYLTWFDAGRNRERNIELAIRYARMAMQRPTPMRACNLLLAYVKDRYYEEARHVMEAVLQANAPECPAERFLQTLFQIRDADLIAWWTWLEGELGKE
jgi:tetratricopeptide (TPR) repeat protein